jgi:multidrug efflux pump
MPASQNEFGHPCNTPCLAKTSPLSSASSLGRAQIQVEFDLSRNPDAAAQDVQAAINAAGGDLPKMLTAPPYYEKVNPADFQLMSIGVTSSDLPLAKIDDYVENYITPKLSRIIGIGLIDYRVSRNRPSASRSIR